MVIKAFGPLDGATTAAGTLFDLIKMPDENPVQRSVNVRVNRPTHPNPGGIPEIDTRSDVDIQTPVLTASGFCLFTDEEAMSTEIARIEAVAMAGIIGVIYRTGVEDGSTLQPNLVSLESNHLFGYISGLSIERSSVLPFGTGTDGLINWSFKALFEFTVTEYDPYNNAPDIFTLII